MFTFTLDLATVNAKVIVIYNKKDYSHSRKIFLRNLAAFLTMSFTTTIERFPLKSVTHRVINDILESCNENITADLAWKSHGYREV